MLCIELSLTLVWRLTVVSEPENLRSKHILLKYHSLRDRVETGLIELCKVDTGFNAADMMTKSVGVGILRVCKQLAGMVNGD